MNVKPNETGVTDNIKIKAETGAGYHYTCVNTSSLFACTLTQLSIGECYTISATSVLNGYESIESTKNNFRICTRK